MVNRYFSHGKLLLTSEYLVLKGAEALAVPTLKGQHLEIEKKDKISNLIIWKSYDFDGSIWFESIFEKQQIIQNLCYSEDPVEKRLIHLLHLAYQHNATFLTDRLLCISTFLDFPRLWGFGSSSTLIHLISQWTNSDPFYLLENTFGGSGYDVACAIAKKPIIYSLKAGKPFYREVEIGNLPLENLYCVYLNKKQSSRDSIKSFYENSNFFSDDIEKANKLTRAFIQSESVEQLAHVIEDHEKMISYSLGDVPTIKAKLFPEFEGHIKSMGAWGGDFLLVLSDRSCVDYFVKKGYPIFLNFKNTIKRY